MRLSLAGLTHHQNHVLKSLTDYFLLTKKFYSSFDRVKFIERYKSQVFTELKHKHNVTIVFKEPTEGGSVCVIEITGADRAITSYSSSLKTVHDSICKDIHTVEDLACIQDFIKTGSVVATNCLVTLHKDDCDFQQISSASNNNDIERQSQHPSKG